MKFNTLEEYCEVLVEHFDMNVDTWDLETYKIKSLETFGHMIAEGSDAFSGLTDFEKQFINYEKYGESLVEYDHDPTRTISPSDPYWPEHSKLFFNIGFLIVRKVDF